MADYKVELHGWGGTGQVRTVSVPDAELTTGVDVKELVYMYGQNDFQPLPMRSVSVGDVLVLGDERWVVKPFGWERMYESR